MVLLPVPSCIINKLINAPATPPEAAPIVLFPAIVILATGSVNEFQAGVEPSDNVCSGFKAALVNLLYPPSLNYTNDVPSY